MQSRGSENYDVVIVGYGPTGMVLACLLGQAGRRIAVVERHAELYGRPRAAVFDDETMRLFQKLGVAAEVAEGTIAYPRYEWLNGSGEMLLELTYDNPGRSGWAEMYMMYQPHLEQVLDGACRALPSVSIQQQTRAHGISQDENGVTVACTTAAGSASETRGRYLVAADGGSSFVRDALTIPVDDYGFEENWLVCDFRETAGLDIPYFRQLCDPVQPTAIVRIGPHHHRFSFMLDRDEPPETATDEARVWQRVSRWARPQDMELIRVANYTFRSRIADSWQQERVLLAGDAAHQMPPFLGQGMCSGIRDAHNLAWKLDLILEGHADRSLLHTYQPEREPQVRAITEKGVELGRVQTMRDPSAVKQRDAIYLQRRAQNRQPERVRFPPYAAGCVTQAETSRATGELFVQGRVRTGAGSVGLFDDLIGPGFVLAAIGVDALSEIDPSCHLRWQDLPAHVVVFASSDATRDGVVAVEDVDGVYASWFAEVACCAALVRPDWYVYGTALDAHGAAELIFELEAHLHNAASNTG